MPGKTSLFILLIFSILYLQCTPKIYDTPEVNVVYTTINVSFTVSASGGMPALFISNGEQPDFSPDGSTVAFTRDYNIYTVPSAGGGESLWIANAIYPCYPESALNIIVFSAATEYSSGVKAIHEAKLYNIEIRTLLSTFGQYDALCPRLFPDGNNLIYTTGMDAENDMMFLSSRPFGSYSIVLASTGKLKIGGIIK